MTFKKNNGKNSNMLSTRDLGQVLKEAHSMTEFALDTVSVNSLIPHRYSKITWDLMTLPDGTEDVQYINFWGFGEYSEHEVIIGDSPLGSKETTTINFALKNPSQLAGKHFFIYDSVGSIAAWFNLDGGNVAPSVVVNRFIEIPISTGDSVNTLALKTKNIFNADSEFTAVNSSSYAMIASSTNGNKTDATQGDSGLTLGITSGTDSINSRYIFIYDGKGNKYHVWWNVNGTGVDPDPDPGISSPIEIALDIAETSSTVAQKTADVIEALQNFVGYSEDNVMVVKNVHEGSCLGVVDGNTGYEIQVIQVGEDKPLVCTLEVLYDSNSLPTSFEVIKTTKD